jgi:flagellar protein FlgJ
MNGPALLTAATFHAAQNTPVPPAIKKASKEFESVFLNEMFSHMFEGSENDPVFGGGRGEQMFKSLMVNEYAKKMAGQGGVGISSAIQRAMIEMQQKINGGVK